MALRTKRFTVYDVMEANGVFDANPANAQSRDPEGVPLYEGPVEYPKMFFHPEGAYRVTVPAEMIVTPLGPKEVGEQRELIWATAKNQAEEAKLRSAGWHDHPAKAIAAGGGTAPAMGAGGRINDLETQIRLLQAELSRQSASTLATARTSGAVVKGKNKDAESDLAE